EHVPYAQSVNEALLQRLKRAGQPVLAMAAFLQDSLAVVVLEGLLDQIEMMKRQHIIALEHIKHAGKCKAPAYKELMVEPKQARAPARRPQEFVQAPVPAPPEATGLYYYIGMDPNWVHLWKCMAAHGMLPLVSTATNITLMELSLVDAIIVSGPLTPPRTKLAPHESATNIAIGNVAMTLELGEVLEGNAGHEP
ncbi:hypothetical protein C0995_006513, partial [Termitomyces sp. Mi166